jgi:hypothetical protein
MTEIIMGIVATWIGGVVYAIRQEGRINLHDKQHEDHDRELAKLRTEQADLKREIREDLSYIRERVDDWMGKR